MTTREKLARVESALPAFGLGLALKLMDLPRSTWYYRQGSWCSYEEKHAALRPELEAIAREHPEYGYRRTVDELAERLERRVNHKVVQRLNRLWNLPLQRRTKPPRPSGIGPLEVVYTDFTELPYALGRAYLLVILDHLTKLVLGYSVGERAVTALALKAWRRARRTLSRLGLSTRGMIVHQDQDPVFTSYRWAGELQLGDGVRLSYALNGARDNAAMESFYGRFKTENASLLQDAPDVGELEKIVGERIRYYNRVRRHSSLGNQAPQSYLESLTLPEASQ
jgi:putative transposase